MLTGRYFFAVATGNLAFILPRYTLFEYEVAQTDHTERMSTVKQHYALTIIVALDAENVTLEEV